MLGMHCYHGRHALCDLWPLCDCDCHAEKREESDILAGKKDVEAVHERMLKRRYDREWRRSKNANKCHRCGGDTDGGFTNCAGCRRKMAEWRAKRKHAEPLAAAA